MKSIVKIQGRQFLVEKGDVLKVNRLQKVEPGQEFKLTEILMVEEGKNTNWGDPYLSGQFLTATLLENKRDKKIIVFKKKRRKGYQKKQGHRQELSVIRIGDLQKA